MVVIGLLVLILLAILFRKEIKELIGLACVAFVVLIAWTHGMWGKVIAVICASIIILSILLKIALPIARIVFYFKRKPANSEATDSSTKAD